ncbi:TetR/AcrR family transcriptional regulator [Mobilicoccus pelagius]|uniref:Putative TetR family transcriptional regulator n=1 Tax=Mobilicoccus pelagius NBRC 104925 TaxID=1089455 RepID=H5URK9_9MICO|nr:TetR/AcrR family transcriptional regulator [Mobilicoccus pelagius]GAB48367.1 putative TetR family transcriptional regulator [Mobilicoccus pelagius NBRC 104925]
MTQLERPVSRRERNKAEKRARIREAASTLFAEHGYEKTTMAQVARDADVAIGTVFQYAATKPELLMMVAADRWGQVLDEVRTRLAGCDDPVEAIVTLVDPVIDTAHAEPELSMATARELLFGAAGPHRDEVAHIVGEVESAVADLLRRAGAGDLAPSAARLVVSGALLEINRTRTGRADPASARARLRNLVKVAVRGACSPAGL